MNLWFLINGTSGKSGGCRKPTIAQLGYLSICNHTECLYTLLCISCCPVLWRTPQCLAPLPLWASVHQVSLWNSPQHHCSINRGGKEGTDVTRRRDKRAKQKYVECCQDSNKKEMKIKKDIKSNRVQRGKKGWDQDRKEENWGRSKGRKRVRKEKWDAK